MSYIHFKVAPSHGVSCIHFLSFIFYDKMDFRLFYFDVANWSYYLEVHLTPSQIIYDWVFWQKELTVNIFVNNLHDRYQIVLNTPQVASLEWSSCLRIFFKVGLLKTFVTFTGKHLRWSLFLIRVSNTKRDTSVFQWILQNFQEQLFYRTALVAASGDLN